MSRTPLLPAVLFLIAGCVSQQAWVERDLQEWQGAPVAELLEAWGPPAQTHSDADGRTVLVYDSARQLDTRLEKLRDPAGALSGERSPTEYGVGTRSECTLYFELREERVETARHEGAACDIVARDPARRRADPELRQRR